MSQNNGSRSVDMELWLGYAEQNHSETRYDSMIWILFLASGYNSASYEAWRELSLQTKLVFHLYLFLFFPCNHICFCWNESGLYSLASTRRAGVLCQSVSRSRLYQSINTSRLSWRKRLPKRPSTQTECNPKFILSNYYLSVTLFCLISIGNSF